MKSDRWLLVAIIPAVILALFVSNSLGAILCGVGVALLVVSKERTTIAIGWGVSVLGTAVALCELIGVAFGGGTVYSAQATRDAMLAVFKIMLLPPSPLGGVLLALLALAGALWVYSEVKRLK